MCDRSIIVELQMKEKWNQNHHEFCSFIIRMRYLKDHKNTVFGCNQGIV